MQRSKHFLAFLLAGIAIGAPGSTVRGGVIALPPPGPVRVAQADAVVVGRVEAIMPQDVKVQNMTYRIAVVKINQGLKGTKDAKTVQVGFIPTPTPEDGKPRVFISGARPVQLQPGEDGLFLLKKHAKEDFYTIGGVIGYYIPSDKNPDFEQEVATAKAAVKVLANPQVGLKAKDADERLLAAAVLIDQYRTYRGSKFKQEPIDAEESKQILQVLADADWTGNRNFRSLRPSPAQLFQRLGVTPKDGFVAPAQTWLRENVQKYRIQRIVADNAK